MNIWHDIDKNRIKPEDFYAVVEISKGSKNKYELDKSTGLYYILLLIIPQTMALYLLHTQKTLTH